MSTNLFTFDGKTIDVRYSEKADAPIVFSIDYQNASDAVLEACREIGCPDFHLVSVSGLHWDEELSPWPHDPVATKEDHFTGEAEVFRQKLETEIVPRVREQLPESNTFVLNGYSMGGLFTLYTASKSSLFDAFSAPSGSVWYPDFVEYVRGSGNVSHSPESAGPVESAVLAEPAGSIKPAGAPRAIYLSLGDRESRTRNPYLSKTEDNMRVLEEVYRSRGIPTVFVLNKGNHFQGVTLRVAKGIKWVLETLEKP